MTRSKKIKLFLHSIKEFFVLSWIYPTTPIENFQDARIMYQLSTDEEWIKITKELSK